MINKNNQKRIITNEDIFESVSRLSISNEGILNSISELKQDVSILKSDVSELKQDVLVLKNDVSVLKDDVSGLKQDYKGLRESTIDGFDKVFQLIDETKNELKQDIFVLRKENNQRFTIIENRLSHIEDNMVYKHELSKQFV